MSIEERAEAKYPYIEDKTIGPVERGRRKAIKVLEQSAYIAGATEQQALIHQQRTTANTAPANLLKAYSTFEENAAHQLGFLIGCEWKEAQLSQQTASLEERVKELEGALKHAKAWIGDNPLKACTIIENALNPKQQ